MNITSFSIGKRISFGFLVVLLILLIMGLSSISSMWSVGKTAEQIHNEKVPAIEVANNVERTSLITMYDMRGYAFTEDTKYLDEAEESLKKVKDYLQKAKDLGGSTPSLISLKTAAEKAEQAALSYEKLVGDTSKVTNNLEKERGLAEEAAQKYISACLAWEELEQTRLTAAIQKNAKPDEIHVITKKIEIASSIQHQGYEIIVGTWKSQFRRSPEIFNEAKSRFRKVEDLLGQLRSMAPDVEETKQIDICASAAATYKGNMDRFLTGWLKRNEINQERGDAAAKVLAAAKSTAENQLAATQEATEKASVNLSSSSRVMLAGLIAAIILGGISSFLITRSIVSPISACVSLSVPLSKGDFSSNVPAALTGRGDEVGDLAVAFQTLIENTRTLLKEITAGVSSIATSTTQLSEVSNQTTISVKSVSEKTCTIAAAAEEASTNTVSVAASMEQAATNLSSVASATEEMSATVGEIAKNSETARCISAEATQQAADVSARMKTLGSSAKEIGQVTQTIANISAQTNLLALNATIEAASAGDAGRGFAVVANEIKELARQTAQATENIKTKIAGVQESTESVVGGIERISGVIHEVSSIINTIATAIEEQTSVTRSVSENVVQAAAGVKDANVRTAQTAAVSKETAKDLTDVSNSVADIKQGAENVRASTVELSKVAETLKSVAAQFKV